MMDISLWVEVIAWLLGVTSTSILLLISWLHLRMIALKKELDHVDAKKANKSDIDEIKNSLRTLIETTQNIQLELARWQGRAEAQKQQKN